MSTQEYTYWVAYFKEKVRLEEEAGKKKAKQSGAADRQFKRTMGPQQ